MKVIGRKEKEEFIPGVITITVENQDEFDCLHFLFNYTPIVQGLIEVGGIDCDEVREELNKFGTYRDSKHETLAEILREKI